MCFNTKITITSSFGNRFRIQIFGGSHEPCVGVTMDGLPEGTIIDMKSLAAFLARRAPGNSPYATSRKEPDKPVPLNGLANLKAKTDCTADMAITDGGPLTFIIENTNTRSGDYKELSDVPRPGHADFTAYMKYRGSPGSAPNMAGGGPFSARLTAPLCIAGGIALQLLAQKGITIGAHIFSVRDIQDLPMDPVEISDDALAALAARDFPVFSEEAGAAMKEEIRKAHAEGDSVGGIVEVCAVGLPAGLGGPMYDGLESLLSPIFFGIPAVKGLEFGAGFQSARLLGSQNNDPFLIAQGAVKTRTNHHGGILGGISSGMPLIARLAFKPTPSIAKEQDSVSLSRLENVKLSVRGRHDPCVALRAVPVCEAAMAAGLLDIII